MDNISNQSKYRRIAKIYDLFFAHGLLNKARRRALALLDIRPNSQILIPGIGTGLDLEYIDQSNEVLGLDLSDEMLERCRLKYGNRQNLTLKRCNAEELQSEHKYDYVILNLILSVVESPKKLIHAVLPLIAEDGLILVFDKFQKANKVSVFKKLLNRLTSAIGTDITRNMDLILSDEPLEIVRREDSIFHGNYQIIILRKLQTKAEDRSKQVATKRGTSAN